MVVKAAVLSEPCKPLEIKNFPYPEIEKGGVILDTIFSDVCGTDVHLYHGHLSDVPYPIIPGHISVGQIEKLSGRVTDIDGNILKKGDIVTFLDVHKTCNDCWFCLVAKASTKCPHRKVYGITYSAKEGLLGGWSEKIYLRPGVKIVKLPEDVPPTHFIAAGCGLPTAIHGIERADINLGETVVIQGSGPVGLFLTLIARFSGAYKVITIGAPEPRLELAESFDADHTINIHEFNPQERVKKVFELTEGRGADVTIEATGVPSAIKEGMQMTRDYGTYVILGQYTDAGDVKINPHVDINKKHLTIKGTWGIDFSHFYKAIRTLTIFSDKVQWAKLISKFYTLQQVNQAIKDTGNRKVIKAVIKPR